MPNKATFSDRSWQERETILGDPAERAFSGWANRQGLGHVKYGLSRPPVDMRRLPAFIRYTPDFLTDNGLYEVQGCGHDQTFKFKHDKLWAISNWDDHHAVAWFLWNQPADLEAVVGHPTLLRLCYNNQGLYRHDGMFDGSKPYATVTWEALMQVT